MINFDAKFEPHDHPFPYQTMGDMLSIEDVRRLNAELPAKDLYTRYVKDGPQHPKRYRMWLFNLYEDGARTPRTGELPPAWQELLDSLLSKDFEEWASGLVGMDLSELDLTLGLYAYEDQDFTTVDTGKQRKAVHWAFYLNEDWTERDGGQMHLWTAKDAEQPAVSVVPVGGTSALFFPGPSSWHNIGTITTAGKDRINIMIEYWKS